MLSITAVAKNPNPELQKLRLINLMETAAPRYEGYRVQKGRNNRKAAELALQKKRLNKTVKALLSGYQYFLSQGILLNHSFYFLDYIVELFFRIVFTEGETYRRTVWIGFNAI